MNIDAAFKKLEESERGTNALEAFFRLVEDGGHSLDDGNWRALSMLCETMVDTDGYIAIMDRLRSKFGE